MSDQINDASFVAGIKSNQTQAMATKFNSKIKDEKAKDVLDRVMLMTPEEIYISIRLCTSRYWTCQMKA